MEIISEGHLPSKQLYNGQCRNCGTIFTFQREEARLVPDDRDGDYLTVTCPLPGCGQAFNTAVAKINVGR